MIYRIIKRTLDIILSVMMLIMTFPLILLIMAAIRLDSKGPSILKQKRLGKEGKLFDLLKFRTMINDAEAKTGPVLSPEKDSRVTRVGNVLRNLCIDELLQLWNVLKGDMTIVGPRPERPFFHNKFSKIPEWKDRLKVKQGITGWAQVNGVSSDNPKQKAKLDKYYVDNQGLLMDMKIVLKTFSLLVNKK